MPTLDDLDEPRLRQAARLLERENQKLSKEVLELKAKVCALEGNDPSQLELRIAELEQTLTGHCRRLFGETTEQRPKEESSARARDQAAKGHGPSAQPELPQVETIHRLDEPDRVCPACGLELEEWNGQTEDSEEVDVLERRFVLIKHKRQKYRCRCGSCVETAPTPPRMIPGGRYSHGFAIAVAIAKYADHLPLERQVTMMRRQGLKVTSQTLWDQIEALAAHLEPLHERLGHFIRGQPVVGADETPWKMLERPKKDRNKRWYAWALCSGEGVIYHIENSRSAQAGARILGDFEGTLIADGYAVYRSIQKHSGRFKLAACHAHARRKFWELEAQYPKECGRVLDLYGQLYDIEREVRDASAAERLSARKARSAPLLRELYNYVMSLRVLPRSPLRGAIDYLGSNWGGLGVFLEDPNVSMDNNAVERVLRVVVVGRKNHYGSKSKRGTEVAALFYSLIETAKICGILPNLYLEYALGEVLLGREPKLPHQIEPPSATT